MVQSVLLLVNEHHLGCAPLKCAVGSEDADWGGKQGRQGEMVTANNKLDQDGMPEVAVVAWLNCLHSRAEAGGSAAI
jgi:hypothetical protein